MPESIQHVTFIGDGAMANVLALLLESRGLKVTVWGPHADHVAEVIQTRENRRYLPGHRLPESIRLTAGDASAFRDAQLVVSAIPTQYIRKVWTRLAPHLPASIPIVSVAKGIERDTILRPTQIIADVLKQQDTPAADRAYAALSGPSICIQSTTCT